MPAKGTRKFKREERLEVMRTLALDEGWPRFKIYKAMRDQYGVTDRTIRRDFEELGKRFRQAMDDPDWCETQIVGSVERLKKIAVKAFAEGKYSAAVQAEREIARLHGARSDRWAMLIDQRAAGAVNVEVTADAGSAVKLQIGRRAAEYSELTTEQLEAKRAELRERFKVHEGGKRGEAPPEAKEGRTA